MKLAVSIIGWNPEDQASVLPKLREAGVDGVEGAPSRLFNDLQSATAEQAAAVAESYRHAGLPIVSMQSLLFGHPDLRLFGPPEEVQPLVDQLRHVIGLAGALGCGPLVFGSAQNRRKEHRSLDQARAEAVPVLRQIGDAASAAGSVFCLEANATGYGCDFMTTLEEAGSVVAATGHAGIGQVVDTGNMMMMGEAPAAIEAVSPHLCHLHISAPQLGPVADHPAFVKEAIRVAAGLGYDRIVTLEMRAGTGPDPMADLLRAAEMLRHTIDQG